MKYIQWEYTYIAFAECSTAPGKDMTSRLTALGKQGWEAFATDSFGMWIKRQVLRS